MTTAAGAVPGPSLPDVQMHLHSPADPCEGVVVSTRRCTLGSSRAGDASGRGADKSSGFVRHVAIDVSGTKLAGNFRAGQSFGVLPPGFDERGQSHKLRLYSIASPTRGEDGKGAVLATTVKRLIDEHHETHRLFTGVASNYLCDLKEGDKVRLTGPAGKRFLLPADTEAYDYAFFATGTGVAPFRGMLMDLLTDPARQPSRSRIVLVMGAAYRTDLLYHHELEDLARRFPNFTYLPTLSRERQEDGAPAMYAQDRLNPDTAAGRALLTTLDSSRGLVYVCGIAGMELGIFRALRTALGTEAVAPYLGLEPDAGPPEGWDRKMIHKQVRPTRRVFLEVY
jgi:ferredoxin--NADP+ reductase